MKDSGKITELLIAWKQGDEHAVEDLMPLVEIELRRIAHQYMRRESRDHTLQTTALINEAYLRLVEVTGIEWENRTHFFALSATIMRRILINYARDSKAEKRGGNVQHVDIDGAVILSEEKTGELLDLDEALTRLEEFDKLKSRIVELRYFGGLNIEETAEALGISPSSVSLHWRMARAWLRHEMGVPTQNEK